MGNSNVVRNGNEKDTRKKVLKKAAMLATLASITGACAVGGQKPKESEAFIGALIGIVSTVVGVGTSIGQSVASGVQESNARKAAEEEARRQAEEERVRAALETGEHNVRLQEKDEESKKTIDMSTADNSAVLEQQEQDALARAKKRNSKKPSEPKDVNVGGFGASDDEELEEDVYDEFLEDEEYDEDYEDYEDYEEEDGDYEEEDVYDDEDFEEEDYEEESPSNVVRLSLGDLSFEDDAEEDESDGVVREETVAHGFGFVSGDDDSEDYVEIDESMLMSEEDAENHRLVEEGYLTAEDVILLDFGIRTGAITEEVLDSMYESEDISDEYYDAAIELMYEIYEELEEAE